MGREGCDKSTSLNSNRHSYTSYYYTQPVNSKLGNDHLLCINTDVSDQGCICYGKGTGNLPWTCLVAIQGSSGLHRWECVRLPKAFASTKPGPACVRTPLCQERGRAEEVAAAAVWCIRTGEGRSSNQLSAWGLCGTADFIASRLWGDAKLA